MAGGIFSTARGFERGFVYIVDGETSEIIEYTILMTQCLVKIIMASSYIDLRMLNTIRCTISSIKNQHNVPLSVMPSVAQDTIFQVAQIPWITFISFT